MKLIGAGYPRTGTLSTKVALEQLGFGPCYHFFTQFERPQDIDVWQAADEGEPVDWRHCLRALGPPWTGLLASSTSSSWRYFPIQKCCSACATRRHGTRAY